MDKMSKRPLRVAIITGQLGKGGAERQLYLALRGIDRGLFDVRVLALNPGGWWEGKIRELGVDCTSLPAACRLRFLRLWRVCRWVMDFKPHILHAWNLYPAPYVTVAGRLAATPVKMAFLQGQPDFALDGIGRIGQFSLRHLDAITVNSKTALRAFAGLRVGLLPAHLLRNAVELPECWPDGGDGWGGQRSPDRLVFIIGTVGRLDENKNHMMFLEVLRLLKNGGRRVCGRIAGEGPLRTILEAAIEAKGIQDEARLLGGVDDIWAFLSDIDLFCFTSRSEGLSNAVMEAMAAGVPVVATDVGGIRELIDDGENGFIVPSDDVEAMVERVKMLLDSPELRRRIGLAGRERMKREFTVEKMVDTLQNVYIEMLRRKGYEL